MAGRGCAVIEAIGIIGIVILLVGMLGGGRSIAYTFEFEEDPDRWDEPGAPGCGWLIGCTVLLIVGALMLAVGGA